MIFSSKSKMVISAVSIFVSSIFLAFDVFGLVAFIVLVLSFFTFIIQGSLYWLGYENGDMFEAYQDMERTEAQALGNLLKDKKQCEHRERE